MDIDAKKADVRSVSPDAPSTSGGGATPVHSDTEPTAATVTLDPASLGDVSTAGRWRLERCLGKGSYGEVWKAFDPVLNISVAIKIPRKDRRYTAHDSDLFVEEARKQAKLNHPAIVKVRHAERDGMAWLIVSDLIDGSSLRECMATKRFSAQDSARLVADIADALQVAHQQRIIHRDVKPANILIDGAGKAYLTDFGVALAEDDQLSQKNIVAGTYAYMSPEQVRGEAHLLDGRADIYSLGIVLYELLTGERPCRGNTLEECREQILGRLPKPLRAIDGSIPRELERICLKCLAKSAADRYLTAADLASDLRRSVQPKSRWYMPAAVAAVVLVGIVLAILRPWSGAVPVKSGPTSEEKPAPPVGAVPPPAPRDGWTPLWDRMPTKLVWQARPSSSLLELKEREESIWVVCDGDGLFKLGEVNEPDYTFRVNVKLVDGRGTFAVLLGYRYFQEEGQERALFEMIRLAKNFPGAKEKYLLSDYSVSYSELRGGYPSGHPLAVAKIADVPQRECQLEITVADDRLASVRWDGQLLPDLAKAVPRDDARPRTWRGGICCYVNAGAFYLHRPELKVKKDK